MRHERLSEITEFIKNTMQPDEGANVATEDDERGPGMDRRREL